MKEMVILTMKCNILMLHSYESLRQFIWVLAIVSRPRRVEVTQTCSKLHSDDLHVSYPSPDINGMIESRMIRWVGYVACTGKGRNA